VPCSDERAAEVIPFLVDVATTERAGLPAGEPRHRRQTVELKMLLVGFGVVGQGLIELLAQTADALRETHGVSFRVAGICDLLKGSVYRPDGLSLTEVQCAIQRQESLVDCCTATMTGLDALQMIEQSEASVVVEVTPTDITTGEPAMSHFKAALQTGKHLVTTNKGPTALALHELSEIAHTNGVEFLYEGTVMAGTPVLNLACRFLAGCSITRIRGILNGTTNYLLSRMEEGLSYADALQEAQRLGYAETNPKNDVEGFDTLAKLVILANSLMGANLQIADVACRGITNFETQAVQEASRENARWKLIGEITRNGEELTARVGPEKTPETDPLHSIAGATNAITFSTDLVKDVTIIGPGAGKTETGFALLSDLLEIYRRVAGPRASGNLP
jgi:homoserine dehydrogenase